MFLLCYYSLSVGYLEESRMYYTMRRDFCWSHMAQNVYRTVTVCCFPVQNRETNNKQNQLCLFPRPDHKTISLCTHWFLAENKTLKPVHCSSDRQPVRISKDDTNSPNNYFRSPTSISLPLNFNVWYPNDSMHKEWPAVFITFLLTVCAELLITSLMTTKYQTQTNGG